MSVADFYHYNKLLTPADIFTLHSLISDCPKNTSDGYVAAAERMNVSVHQMICEGVQGRVRCGTCGKPGVYYLKGGYCSKNCFKTS